MSKFSPNVRRKFRNTNSRLIMTEEVVQKLSEIIESQQEELHCAQAVDKLITLLTKVCRQVSRRPSVMLEQGDPLWKSLTHKFQTSEIRVAALAESYLEFMEKEMSSSKIYPGFTSLVILRKTCKIKTLNTSNHLHVHVQ